MLRHERVVMPTERYEYVCLDRTGRESYRTRDPESARRHAILHHCTIIEEMYLYQDAIVLEDYAHPPEENTP